MTYSQFICGHNGDALEISNQATSGLRNPADWFYSWATGGRTSAGVAVNGYTALTHCPLWQGVNIIAGDFGQTPVRLVRDEFTEQKQHPAWNLLRVRPNALQTPSLWKETMMQWWLIWGNAVSWIRRQSSRPVELVPLRPDCIRPELVAFEDEQVMLYHYTSCTTGTQYTFFPDDVIHFQGLTGDGVWGYPLFQVARDTIGYGLALQKHGATTFANGAVPSGVLEAPPTAVGISKNPEARANLRNEWNAVHKGPDKAGAIAILWEGITYKQTSSSNVESQWIEAMEADVYQAARLLNLPPHKLGALKDSSVRANLEEQNADYINQTLNRYYNRADEEYQRKLLTDAEWKSNRHKFVHDTAFLRGDLDTTSTIADRLVKATIINPNEGRRMLALPPREGGETYGNPATSQQPEDGKESPDNGRPPGKTNKGSDSTKVAIDMPSPRGVSSKLKERLRKALKTEAAVLVEAAKSERNFINWMDAFYGDGKRSGHVSTIFNGCMGKSRTFQPKEAEVSRVRAGFAKWVAARRESILELCSTTTASDLIEALHRFTEVVGINESCDAITGQNASEY